MIAHLARAQQSPAALRRTCPAIFMTSDLRLPLDPAEQAAALEEVRAAFAEYPRITIDGIRVNFPAGWALARSSVTEPALTFRFEGDTPDALQRIVRDYCDRLPRLREELYRQFIGKR
jgi:phosphomannomutase/phosphoglucomutase